MSSTKFYLLYVVTGALALSISVFVGISTVWPGWKTLEGNNASDFEADFDFFWRDENGRAPIFLASHFVNKYFYTEIKVNHLEQSMDSFYCLVRFWSCAHYICNRRVFLHQNY